MFMFNQSIIQSHLYFLSWTKRNWVQRM